MKISAPPEMMGEVPLMTAANPAVEISAVTEERRINSPALNTKPPSQTISLRLPDTMVEDIKALARQRDVSFQTLVKVFLAEKLAEELPDY